MPHDEPTDDSGGPATRKTPGRRGERDQGGARDPDERPAGKESGKRHPATEHPPADRPGNKGGSEDVDGQLDEELEESFPASDPPSLTRDPR